MGWGGMAWYTKGLCSMVWSEVGWDGVRMGRDGVGVWDGMGKYGMGWDGMVWDRMGKYGIGRDETGWHVTRRGGEGT